MYGAGTFVISIVFIIINCYGKGKINFEVARQ